jgi:hypothetical protein
MSDAVSPVQSASETGLQVPGFLRFAVLGACGGLCAFFFSRLLGAGPFIGKPIYLDLPGEILVGSCAALFGVYLLTASDVAATRTMAFALACGLFWSPIITSVQTYVQQHAEQQTVTSAQQASTLASQAAGQSGTEAESTIKAASSQISEALTKLPTVATPNSRDQIVASSKSVVASIAAPKAGVASVEALKNIGAASVKGGSPQVTLLAIEKLKQIEASAPTPATRVAAEKAVASLASASPGIVQEPAKQGPAR